MKILSRFLLLTLLAISLAACDPDEVVITINVDSEEKISETQGDFDGDLTINSEFGSAIAVIGDLEADGVGDMVVGSPHQHGQGAVWVLFMNKNGTVDLETEISFEEGGFNGNLNNDDAFGSAVAGIGDLDGDGFNDIAVGAPFDDDGGDNRGAVWILFLQANGKVKAHQKISDDAGSFSGKLEDNDAFGSAIATLGDLDGDGITELAVGAPLADDNGIDAGAVWILFMNMDGSVRSHKKLSGNSGRLKDVLVAGDQFGQSLSNLGDFDKDGVTDLVAGSPGMDDDGLDRGAIWILYLDTDGSVASKKEISASKSELSLPIVDGDHFGEVVANAGDIDEDGVTDIAVGLPFDDDGAADSGAVYILFMNKRAEIDEIQKISSTQGIFNGILNSDDHFGAAIASVGDLNNKRAVDLAIGAPLDDNGGIDKGAVWILFLDEPDTRTECERDALLRFLGVGNCN